MRREAQRWLSSYVTPHATRPAPVVPGVFQASVRASSVFFLLDRRVTLIDAGPVGDARRVLAALRRLGRAADEVEQIIISHAHPDHAGGLAALQRLLPARTAVHVLEAPALRGQMPLPPLTRTPWLRRGLRPALRALTPPARIDTVLRDGDELPVLGGLRVVHTPGHTPGHIALHLPERGLLIAGDALQVRGGRLIGPSRRFSTDLAAAMRSLRRITALDFEVLALSHFPPQRDDLRSRLAGLAGPAGAPADVAAKRRALGLGN